MDLNNNLIAESVKMVEKWSEYGLLEGIEDEHTKRMTALMLENQKLANESPLTEALTGGTDTSDVSQFRRISIPLVRRIYPQLVANKIVSVQPLLGPTGLVYYLRFRYGSNKGSTLGQTNRDLAVGTAGAESITMQQQTDGDANLDIWYAHQRINNEAATAVLSSANLAVITLGHTPLLNNGQLFADIADANANNAVTAATAGGFPGAYGSPVGSNVPYMFFGTVTWSDASVPGTSAFDISISSAATSQLRIVGTANAGAVDETVNGTLASGVYTYNITDITPVVGGNMTCTSISFTPATGVLALTGAAIDTAADSITLSSAIYEYDMECNVDLPEVNLVVESETITAKTRKLKAVWSFEAQQDLRSQHNIDAEAELTQILAKEINLEIDREIITDLRINAGTVAT